MKSLLVASVLAGFVSATAIAQEPRGWKQPLLQPTIPPTVVGGGATPEWRMPLVYPTIPPTVARKALVKQHHQLFVPQRGTNGLRIGVTNVAVIVPVIPNGLPFETANFVVREFETSKPPLRMEYVQDWNPQLMYPTYPPKLAPLGQLGLLEPH